MHPQRDVLAVRSQVVEVGPDRVKGESAPAVVPEVGLSPASQFSFDQLVKIYNQARVDYIVPMPMNAARLEAYTHKYDVRLDASFVAQEEDFFLGLAMLGLRSRRSWITRLGVIPVRRRHGAGQALMERLIEESRQRGVDAVTLEVIKNNIPAHKMFHKLGFRDVRELLIVRRPPGVLDAQVPAYTPAWLDHEEAVALLQLRESQPSWVDDMPSLLNMGGLLALTVELENGDWGWVVYRKSTFQLSSLVFQTEVGDPCAVGRALAHALHTRYPHTDTKSENLPADDPHWPALKALGYLEAFSRIEMHLPLV